TNVHVVLEEPPAGPRPRASVAVPAEIGREPRPDPTAPAHLILLTAPTPALLGRAAQELAAALPALEPEVGLADVAYTLARRRGCPCSRCSTRPRRRPRRRRRSPPPRCASRRSPRWGSPWPSWSAGSA